MKIRSKTEKKYHILFHCKRRILQAESMKIPAPWQKRSSSYARKWNYEIRVNVEQTRLPTHHNTLTYRMINNCHFSWEEKYRERCICWVKKQFSPREMYHGCKITQFIENSAIKTVIYFQLLSFSGEFAHQMLSKSSLWKNSF